MSERIDTETGEVLDEKTTVELFGPDGKSITGPMTGEEFKRMADRVATDVVTINTNHLRAVHLFAARGDIRYYLNGVLVHVMDDGAVRLVATNGHVLAITHTPAEAAAFTRPHARQIIVPIETVTLFAKHKTEEPQPITIATTADGYTMETLGLSVNFKAIDGRFPDYERIVPATTSGKASQYHPAYLTLFGKAAAVYSKERLMMVIEHNGGVGAALVHLWSSEFIGVLMPCTMELDEGLPDWITPKSPLAMPVVDEETDEIGLPGIAPPPKPEDDSGPLATAGVAERLSEGDRKRKPKGNGKSLQSPQSPAP